MGPYGILLVHFLIYIEEMTTCDCARCLHILYVETIGLASELNCVERRPSHKENLLECCT